MNKNNIEYIVLHESKRFDAERCFTAARKRFDHIADAREACGENERIFKINYAADSGDLLNWSETF